MTQLSPKLNYVINYHDISLYYKIKICNLFHLIIKYFIFVNSIGKI